MLWGFIPLPKDWPPRDWRMLIALGFLGGGGVAMTVLAWRLTGLVAMISKTPWPLAYALYGTLGLIAVVLTGFSYVLGKRSFAFKAGDVSASSSGGQDDDASRVTVETTTKTTVPASSQGPTPDVIVSGEEVK